MIDTSTAIRDFLLANVTLGSLTGTRIFAERDTPPEGYQPADGAALCLKRRGGGHDYEAVVLSPSYQFKCYGSDEAAANALYMALFEALNQQGNYLIKSAEQESQGQTLYEANTGWPFVLVYYRLQVLN